jgi:hypothetical protein
MRKFVVAVAALVGACGQTTYVEEPAELAAEPSEYSLLDALGGEDEVFEIRNVGGMEIQFPSHWYVLSDLQNAEVRALASELANSTPSTGAKETLLAVNATPAPTSAMIRLSRITPAVISEAEFQELTNSGGESELLRDVHRQFSDTFPAMMSEAGIAISQIDEPSVVSVSGRPAILIPYQRTSAVDGSTWEVRMYQIAVEDATFELTLSNRVADREIWTPILDWTLHSLFISRHP